MSLFRKRQAVPAGTPVMAFWTWWAQGGHEISPHRASHDTDELSRLVAAIHPELTWHFGPGVESQHRLTVSAGGVAQVRPAAERWLRAAPSASPTWEFRSSQEADPGALSNLLEIGGSQVDLALTVFQVDVVADELRVHVGVHHPAFAQLANEACVQISYMVLDWLVGEDDVERWLGHIEALDVRPASAVVGDDLLVAVASVAALRDPDSWVLAEWQDAEGWPGLATFRRGLRWIDSPSLDRHQTVTTEFAARENGFPIGTEGLDALRDIEAELESVLGLRGVLVGHETHRGTRAFHAYTDGEDQNIDALLAEWVSGRGLSLTAQADPAWSAVRHFTG